MTKKDMLDKTLRFAILPMLGFGALSDRSVVTEHGEQLIADAAAWAHAAHPDLTVTRGLQDGYASEALVAASRTAALVVVGATGHGILSQASVGPTAMQVVTHSRCPVLVVGHETSGGPTPGGEVVHHLGDRLAVRLGGGDLRLCARDAARRDQLLGAGDLLRGLDASDPPSQDPFLTTCHTYELSLSGIRLGFEGGGEVVVELADGAGESVVLRDLAGVANLGEQS